MSFQHLGLPISIQRIIKQLGYTQAFPIQEQIIPSMIKGKDVVGIAPTGSGKTASFVLPILAQLERNQPSLNRNIKVLILVPTRELAVQIQDFLAEIIPYFTRTIRSMAVYGGVSILPQMKYMNGVEILVATPGRLLELIEKKAVSLSQLSHLVVDEADKLFQLGFEQELQNILNLLPIRKQVALFSATLNDDVDGIIAKLGITPNIARVDADEKKQAQIEQKAYMVTPERKGPFLRYLIKTYDLNKVLVFVASQRTADNLVDKLRKNKIAAVAIHGKKSMGARTDGLQEFKLGKVQVLVTTDLLSRGIHIDDLPAVINFDLPRSPLDYVHRIGRTGRIHASGVAYTIITPEDAHHFKIIQKKMGETVDAQSTEDFNLHGY